MDTLVWSEVKVSHNQAVYYIEMEHSYLIRVFNFDLLPLSEEIGSFVRGIDSNYLLLPKQDLVLSRLTENIIWHHEHSFFLGRFVVEVVPNRPIAYVDFSEQEKDFLNKALNTIAKQTQIYLGMFVDYLNFTNQEPK